MIWCFVRYFTKHVESSQYPQPPLDRLDSIVDTKNDPAKVTAMHLPSATKQWAIFQVRGLVLNLHGQQMEMLLDGNVMVFAEGSHHTLWVSTASGTTERFKASFGTAAHSHLLALALRQKPIGSLATLQDNLQRAIEDKLKGRHRQHRPVALAV